MSQIVLSAREKEIVDLIVAEGLSDKQIAERLYIERNTVSHHLRNIYRRIGVTSDRQMLAALRGNVIAVGRKERSEVASLREKVEDLSQKGILPVDIAERLGVHRKTVYRHLREIRKAIA